MKNTWKELSREMKGESRLLRKATRGSNDVAWRRAPVVDGCDEQRPLSDAWRTQSRGICYGTDAGWLATTWRSLKGGSRTMAEAPKGPQVKESRWGGRVDGLD